MGRATLQLFLSALVTLLFVAPPSANGQPGAQRSRVGLLFSGYSGSEAVSQLPVWLSTLGYREPQDVTYETRLTGGSEERLLAMAAELVRTKVDVIVTEGVAAVRAARAATTTIPIVMLLESDPVTAGLVTTLARPGGNLTGLMTLGHELTAKRLELLKAAVPRANKVAVLWNPDYPEKAQEYRELEAAALALGVPLQSLEVRMESDLELRFREAARGGAGGLLILVDRLISANAKLIGQLAIKHRLPAMYPSRWFVEIFGHEGLMSYEPNQVEVAQRLAAYVNRILRGTRPGDLPIEQPATFDLVVNLKAARAIGLTLPSSFLVRATKVIP